jgi:hypothetical protein
MGSTICFKCLPKSDAIRKLKSEKKLLDQINIFFCDNRGVSESFFNFNKVFKIELNYDFFIQKGSGKG